MFIKNFISIKCETIETDNSLKDYLVSLKISPLSINKGKWIFRKTQEVSDAINTYKKGG